MPTYHFQEVAIYGEKKTKCTVCQKRMTRKRKFFQTLSPFNKALDGTPKTAEQVRSEIGEQHAAWLKEPETHQTCTA